ncbi:hypothetical protein WR25_00916 [Diploscapter pachys]|uniref:Uncharacterized protein n=1 Tax=Diploscapter pachys TaxID=2018661 RepID=A0A2A2KVY7_9BILA|nr:hypothetical protein WR25_00916 [Diploscapter pachys]
MDGMRREPHGVVVHKDGSSELLQPSSSTKLENGKSRLAAPVAKLISSKCERPSCSCPSLPPQWIVFLPSLIMFLVICIICSLQQIRISNLELRLTEAERGLQQLWEAQAKAQLRLKGRGILIASHGKSSQFTGRFDSSLHEMRHFICD